MNANNQQFFICLSTLFPTQVTPLHLAALFESSTTVVSTLVQAGSNLDALDSDQESPLHWAFWTPCAENAKINVKVIGASQEMCSYLPLLQKLPAALVIRKVKVTKHSSRVSLREIFT